jgi:hypothetical protein
MDDPQSDRQGQAHAARRFDPAAGVRALADIQAEGLRAAGELLDRILGSEPAGPAERMRSPAGDYAAVVDAWMELLRQTVAALAEPGRATTLTVPVDSSGLGPPVRLVLNGSGASSAASGEVWLHNGTSSPVGPLTLRCSPLTTSDDTVLDAAEVSFDPSEVPRLEPRSSRAVTVALAVKGAPRPGAYRGTIQAEGAPRLWLPIEVVIEPS